MNRRCGSGIKVRCELSDFSESQDPNINEQEVPEVHEQPAAQNTQQQAEEMEEQRRVCHGEVEKALIYLRKDSCQIDLSWVI
jgi:hypothetical protein